MRISVKSFSFFIKKILLGTFKIILGAFVEFRFHFCRSGNAGHIRCWVNGKETPHCEFCNKNASNAHKNKMNSILLLFVVNTKRKYIVLLGI